MPTRFTRVWTTRSASTKTGVVGALADSPISDCSAISCTWPTAVETSASAGWNARFIETTPASIRSMSRMSLISRVSRSLLSRAMSTIRPALGANGPRAPPESSPSAPRIEVSGVRSSWLTIETNSLFIRSTSRRWVTSRKTTTAPVTASPSMSGVAVTSTGICSPSARV